MTETLKGKWVLLLLYLFLGIFVRTELVSADDTIYSPSYVGRYQSKTGTQGTEYESVVGVRVRLHTAAGKKKLLAGGVDTWTKSTSGNWSYIGSEVNGEQGQYTSKINGTLPVGVFGTSTPRFALFSHLIKLALTEEGVTEEYSIITQKICRGKTVEEYVDYSFQTPEVLGKHSDSLMQQLRGNLDYLELSSYSAEGISYDYLIYPSYPIQSSGKVSVDAGQCSIAKAGTAFYNGSYYYIHKLPELSAPKGYSLKLEGWYDQKEGGTKYEEGNLIAPSKTLYPHYSLTINQYTVRCMDVIGSESGLCLGSSQWKQTYQTTATGAQAGIIPLADTYYTGVYYTGCSTQVVGENGATVYRFFQYADYPVTVIDMVNTGNQQGKVLGTVHVQGGYQQLLSGGALLGDNPAESIYYAGYVYQGQSSARVETAGTTVYRYFCPLRYSIRFDGNGATGGNMAPLTACEYDSSVTLPPNSYDKTITVSFDLQAEDAVYDSHELLLRQEFCGWSEQPDSGTAYADSAVIKNVSEKSGEKTLYANWKQAEWQTGTTPKRLGYQFAGWSKKPEDTKGNSTFLLTEDTTLYAVWKADVVNYHVEYYQETKQGLFEKSASYSFQGYTGKEISLEQMDTCYAGYYNDADSSTLSGIIQGDGSLVLSVYFRRNTYTVEFDLSGGTAEKEYPVFSALFEDSIEIPVQIPVREHYQFAGWTADKGSTQIYCRAGEMYHIPNHNQTLYAVWQPDTYRVQYMDGKQLISEEEYCFNEDIVLPECQAVRTGYQFAGWKLQEKDGACYQAGEHLTSLYDEEHRVVNIYADWKPVTGEVVLHRNAPEDAVAESFDALSAISYTYDEPCILPKETYHVTGYRFAGWNTKPDGSGETFQSGESIRNQFTGEGEYGLFAVWEPIENTRFVLHLTKEGLPNVAADKEILVLQGITNQTVREALYAHYHATDMEEIFTGFSISHPENLESRIQGDGTTVVELELLRKEYAIAIVSDFEDKKVYYQTSRLYGESIELPAQLEEIGSVAQYEDSSHTSYPAGEAVTVSRSLTLVPMHRVQYQIDGSVWKTRYVRHNGYEKTLLPEETKYAFDGWYSAEEETRYCSGGETLQVTHDLVFEGKWSDIRLTYQIRYELGAYEGVVALETFVRNYQSGKSVLLPTAAQLYIPEPYRFVGWYEQGDSTRTIRTEIDTEEYGNKLYCLLLEKSTGENTASASPSPTALPSASADADKPDSNTATKAPALTPLPDKKATPNPTPRLPINGNTKNAAPSPAKTSPAKNRFTKQKLTYQIISGKKKQVAVVGSDRKLRSVKIPAKVTVDNTVYTVKKIADKAFYRHPALKKVIIGKQVTYIGRAAFARTPKLRSVTVGSSVRQIQAKAFYGAKAMKKLVFTGKQLQRVGKKAFGQTNRTLKIQIPKSCGKSYRGRLKKAIHT